jgi:hypothetical protein
MLQWTNSSFLASLRDFGLSFTFFGEFDFLDCTLGVGNFHFCYRGVHEKGLFGTYA